MLENGRKAYRIKYPSVKAEIKILTLKDISTFSPPQISILSSYVPMCSKYFFEIEKRPPAKVGVLKKKDTKALYT